MLACLALGSRGDVEPLLAVVEEALLEAQRSGSREVQATFACRPSVWAMINANNRCTSSQVQFAAIRDCSVQMSMALQARRKGIPLKDMSSIDISDEEADEFSLSEREDMFAACGSSAVVLCNLFSLEGVHIAEKIGAQCVVLSPCLLPIGGCPTRFEADFSATFPTLFSRLEQESAAQQQRNKLIPKQLADCLADRKVCWADVKAWMWRLFLDDHGSWREEVLGLPAVPLDLWDRPETATPLPLATPLLFGVPRRLALSALRSRQHGVIPASSSEESDGGKDWRLAAVPEGHLGPWETSICGPWRRKRGGEAGLRASPLPESLSRFLCTSRTSELPPHRAGSGGSLRTVCICFGSMPHLGFLGLEDGVGQSEDSVESRHGGERRGVRLLMGLMRGLRQRQWKGLWMLSGWPPAVAAQVRGAAGADGSKHCVLEEQAEHADLLQHCDALVHHGGAGTIAASLLAGCAQVVCPVTFDQREWAEAVRREGLGAVVELEADDAAIAAALSAVAEVLARQRRSAGRQGGPRETPSEAAAAAAGKRSAGEADGSAGEAEGEGDVTEGPRKLGRTDAGRRRGPCSEGGAAAGAGAEAGAGLGEWQEEVQAEVQSALSAAADVVLRALKLRRRHRPR